jgi:hypothetical protein
MMEARMIRKSRLEENMTADVLALGAVRGRPATSPAIVLGGR